MKNKKFLSMVAAAAMFAASVPALTASAALTVEKTKTGVIGDYNYELWNQWDQGTTIMNINDDGSFSCEWSGIENSLFRTGKKFSPEIQYSTLGNVTLDYDCDYQPNGNSYLCVYGWTRRPLIEYYIVESWGTWRPPGGSPIGVITVDGAKYDVYKTERVNQPSIDGDTTFYQYWSVRQEKRTSGKISVIDHFKEWEKLGLEMGDLYEIALNVEGYQSAGKANVKKNVITLNDEAVETEPVKPVEPDDKGYYFHSTFESGTDSWSARGDGVSVQQSSSASCAGNNSLAVSGRTDGWNGASIDLSTQTFVPGNTYSFSAMVMQNAGNGEELDLTLQYNLNGEENYKQIASVVTNKGEWGKLENTAFTIPEGASQMILYVETPEKTIDFYVDEAIGAKEGVKNPNSGSSSGSSTKKGDVNADGKVDVKDVIDLKKYLLTVTDSIDNAADVSGDGNINIIDLVLLKHIIITPVQEPAETEPPVTTTPEPETTTSETTVQHNPADAVCKAEPSQNGVWQNNADISWIDPSKPMVAICFDDGPVGTAGNASSTRILNALENNGFHSTFFYWGNRINDNTKAEITRAFNMGCEVANHSYTHPNLTEKSANEIRNEINTTLNILSGITGGKNFLLRPPYLAVNDNVKANVYCPMITCSMDSGDWNNATAQQMIDKIVGAMNDGSLNNQIVLMHETYNTTAEAIEYLAPYMKERGWQIVNVSELFKVRGKDMYCGEVYSKVQ